MIYPFIMIPFLFGMIIGIYIGFILYEFVDEVIE